MTVKEMIKALADFAPDSKVFLSDPDTRKLHDIREVWQWAPGIVYVIKQDDK